MWRRQGKQHRTAQTLSSPCGCSLMCWTAARWQARRRGTLCDRCRRRRLSLPGTCRRQQAGAPPGRHPGEQALTTVVRILADVVPGRLHAGPRAGAARQHPALSPACRAAQGLRLCARRQPLAEALQLHGELPRRGVGSEVVWDEPARRRLLRTSPGALGKAAATSGRLRRRNYPSCSSCSAGKCWECWHCRPLASWTPL